MRTPSLLIAVTLGACLLWGSAFGGVAHLMPTQAVVLADDSTGVAKVAFKFDFTNCSARNSRTRLPFGPAAAVSDAGEERPGSARSDPAGGRAFRDAVGLGEGARAGCDAAL